MNAYIGRNGRPAPGLVWTTLVASLAVCGSTPARQAPPGDESSIPPPVLAGREVPGLPLALEPAGPSSEKPVDVSMPHPEGTPEELRTGRPIYPIDLAGALRLAGARDLDIAIARERVAVAVAELQGARVLWLPSFFLGPNWNRLDGSIQDSDGNIITTSRSSLYLGAAAASSSPVYAPPPGGGVAPVSGLASVLRISDAVFLPMAARHVVAAREARLSATTNDILLSLTESYFDLQQEAGRVAIAREALLYADQLVDLTRTYAETGAGVEADHQRSLAERQRLEQDLSEAIGRWKMASAELVRRTRLDPRIVVAPAEPPEVVVRVVPASIPVDDLIVTGLTNRPELAEAQALVQATLVRLKQARLRPLIPSLAVRYSAGGFGGGKNDFFGDFQGRQDADVNLYWEIMNLGLGDRAIMRARLAENRATALQKIQVQDRVAADVSTAYEEGLAAERRLADTTDGMEAALRSLSLNFENIRLGAGLPRSARPIEVLQPIQALAQTRALHLDAALDFNRAQFRLHRAMGRPAALEGGSVPPPPGPEPILPGGLRETPLPRMVDHPEAMRGYGPANEKAPVRGEHLGPVMHGR